MLYATQRRRAAVGGSAVGLLALLLPAIAWADSDTSSRDRHINDRFGSTVAIVGDDLLIGASGDNSAAFNGGAVYVFERDDDDGTLVAKDKLYPEGIRGQEWFGTAMASDGERLIVGGVEPPVLGHPTTPRKRAAWIFRREGGAWSQEAELLHDDEAVLADSFGSAVAISGERAAVLARAVQVGDGYVDNRVDVFSRGEGGWRREARLLPEAGYGIRDLVLVGEHLLIAGAQSGGSAAYSANGGSWDPEELPDLGLPRDLAVLQAEPPRVASVDGAQVSILQYEGEWAVTGMIELPDNAVYTQQSIAGVGDLLVALCRAEGEMTTAHQAVSYRLQGGAWEGFGEPVVHEYYGSGRGSVAVTEGRLVITNPRYPRPDDKFTSEGRVMVYTASAEGWELDDELIPGPLTGGCQIGPPRGGPAGLLLALLALAQRRRRR